MIKTTRENNNKERCSVGIKTRSGAAALHGKTRQHHQHEQVQNQRKRRKDCVSKRTRKKPSIANPVQKSMRDAGTQTDHWVCPCAQPSTHMSTQVSDQVRAPCSGCCSCSGPSSAPSNRPSSAPSNGPSSAPSSCPSSGVLSGSYSGPSSSSFDGPSGGPSSSFPSSGPASGGSVPSSISTSFSSNSAVEVNSSPTISDFPLLTRVVVVSCSWSYMSHQPYITSDMREVLVNWMVQVHESFHLLPETLYLSVHVVDKFSGERIVPRKYYQLLGAVALFMSAKHEEVSCPTLRELVLACDHAYTAQQFKNLEALLLSHCRFTLLAPTSFHHACTLLQPCFQSNLLWRNFVLYLLELTLLDYTFLRYKHLDLAATACWLVFKLQRHHAAVSNPQLTSQSSGKMSTFQSQAQSRASNKLCHSTSISKIELNDTTSTSFTTRQTSMISPPETLFLREMGFSSHDLMPCLFDLLRLVAGTPPNSPRSVRTKYATSRYLKVALFDWMQFPFVPLTLSSLEEKRDDETPLTHLFTPDVPLEQRELRPVQQQSHLLPSPGLSAALTAETSDSYRSHPLAVLPTEYPRTPPTFSRKHSIVV